MILKLDIEHDEWDLFDSTPLSVLKRFRQIVGEFHGFDFLDRPDLRQKMARVFEKLTQDHALIHVHANNYCAAANVAGVVLPFVMEMTFASRSFYDLVASDEIFPGPLDSPCDPTRPDLIIGAFRF